MLREVRPHENKNQRQKKEGWIWIGEGGRTVSGGAGSARRTLVRDVLFKTVKLGLKGRRKSISIITFAQMITTNCLSKILSQQSRFTTMPQVPNCSLFDHPDSFFSERVHFSYLLESLRLPAYAVIPADNICFSRRKYG